MNKQEDINKLRKLQIYDQLNSKDMLIKLNEEIKEVTHAILTGNKENLAEELLDVMQCCVGIAHTEGVDIDLHIEKHNKKLLNRGHKFI